MNDKDIAARYAVAQEVIREAGALAARYFADLSSLTIKNKGPQDVVSEADLNTELLIRDRLKAAFPDDAFFGEETGPQHLEGAEGVWVVDPIDGTQPFVSGMSSWCVSIAFVVGDSIEIGLVYAPAADEFFAARKGHGATLNGRPIKLHPGKSLRDGITSVGYSARMPPAPTLAILTRLLEGGGMYHRSGSGTLGLCYVACGRLVGYVEVHINSWDCLAAICIIREAGGVVNDFLADDGLVRGNRIVAGSPAVYPQLESLFG